MLILLILTSQIIRPGLGLDLALVIRINYLTTTLRRKVVRGLKEIGS